MVGCKILPTRYTPGADGLRQFRVGELVRLVTAIGTIFPANGYVVSNDGTKFTVRWDFDCGENTFDLKEEQVRMKQAEDDTKHFLSALDVDKACDNAVAYTRAKMRAP